MAWYGDLTPCTYFDHEQSHGGQLLAVGWLEQGHDYHKGEVAGEVIKKLVELFTHSWQPYRCLGWHDCNLCAPPARMKAFHHDQRTISMGISNLFVPGEGVLYAAPSLILHYIDAHEYAPPAAFCAAVLACPPMGSEEYLQAIIRNGPPEFAREARETPRKVQ